MPSRNPACSDLATLPSLQMERAKEFSVTVKPSNMLCREHPSLSFPHHANNIHLSPINKQKGELETPHRPPHSHGFCCAWGSLGRCAGWRLYVCHKLLEGTQTACPSSSLPTTPGWHPSQGDISVLTRLPAGRVPTGLLVNLAEVRGCVGG